MAFSGMNSTSFHTDQANNQRKRDMQIKPGPPGASLKNSSNDESLIILGVGLDQGQAHLGVRSDQTRAIL